ncbi:MAG TPA: GIY-YIG nuclease family protein [Feifaniaceae bacterium]|nr:GIY-YIG nuclease family protein [Feifaniaceae bacterium]
MDGEKRYYTYILRCSDGTLYTGYAADPMLRAQAHNAGKGAKYTRARLPVTLVYTECFCSRGAAQRREAQIKQLSRAQKLLLVEQHREPPGGD